MCRGREHPLSTAHDEGQRAIGHATARSGASRPPQLVQMLFDCLYFRLEIGQISFQVGDALGAGAVTPLEAARPRLTACIAMPFRTATTTTAATTATAAAPTMMSVMPVVVTTTMATTMATTMTAAMTTAMVTSVNSTTAHSTPPYASSFPPMILDKGALRKRRLFVTTVTLLNAIASAANAGWSARTKLGSQVRGYKAPAATGMSSTL